MSIASFVPHQPIQIRGRSWWRCEKCGKVAAGDSVTISPDSLDPDDITRAARSIHPQAMPVGWSSYGPGFDGPQTLCEGCAT